VTIDQFKSKYKESSLVNRITKGLEQEDIRTIRLEGLVGSAVSVVANAVYANHNGNYLFVLSDKEEAAYFYNDLESLSVDEKGTTLLFYPSSYRRPYQIEEIDNANVIQRAEVLNVIRKKRKNILVVTYPEAMVENVVTRKQLEKNTLELEVGVNYSIEFINELLISYDFEKVDHVYHPGQFAVRGYIVDIYSYSNELPYRVEFFGDEIESIRVFNPADQLSVTTEKKIQIVPNLSDKLLYESREPFLNYLPADTTIWIKGVEQVKSKILQGYDLAKHVYERLDSSIKRLAPAELYQAPVDFENHLLKTKVIEFGKKHYFDAQLVVSFNCQPQPPFNKNFNLLKDNLVENTENGLVNVISAKSSSQLERIKGILNELDGDAIFFAFELELHEGFIDHDRQVAFYTDHQLFERYHKFKLKEGYKKAQESFTLKEIYDLQKGDFVVHIDHGVGQFSGLEKIDVNGKEQEAVRLIYKGGDILYVSIHSLHRISKFTGKEGTAPSLNRLGTPAWNAAKQKAKSQIKSVAFDLIQLYAKRKASKGFSFSPDNYLQTELEASFIYEDTPDQFKATQKVKQEMEAHSPMDLLICGDVGFGKTEVAIRAAFKAALDGKQTVVLVPTTVLAFQHFKTFSERLKDFPVKVDYINRFKSAKKVKESIRELENGTVDIIIGTHMLAGKDIKFKDLGLLVIDEEQKFGVAVKDKLKTLKANIDTLTLTATPIPRTLQFSLMNARDLCVINTPPPNRYPVDTIVQSFNEETIRDAVSYEVQRGGQVFFVHNRVQNIQEVAGMIQRLCPDVRVAVGHGQMDGKQLEAIILDFMEGVFDVLVATTIIEAGIDIPNANTIIINNAHHFGLSDLHQLRGRVGRSNKKAFAYLFTPLQHHLTEEARKRIRAIEQFNELGSGFNIAMRDLDIRGAGDLLGGNQSGFISEIGFETYQKILDEAIHELKETEFKELFKDELKNRNFVEDCVLETDLQLVIPDDYVNDITERLSLYREMDGCKDGIELNSFLSKLKDRFGELPKSVLELSKAIELRWLGKEIGFEKIVLKQSALIGTFVSDENSAYYQSPRFTAVLEYVKSNQKTCSMTEKNGKLRMRFDSVGKVEFAVDFLRQILPS
jgi:transcription-repair coupling factor (superfamily II helicase)